jgi:hypothetical protein
LLSGFGRDVEASHNDLLSKVVNSRVEEPLACAARVDINQFPNARDEVLRLPRGPNVRQQSGRIDTLQELSRSDYD